MTSSSARIKSHLLICVSHLLFFCLSASGLPWEVEICQSHQLAPTCSVPVFLGGQSQSLEHFQCFTKNCRNNLSADKEKYQKKGCLVQKTVRGKINFVTTRRVCTYIGVVEIDGCLTYSISIGSAQEDKLTLCCTAFDLFLQTFRPIFYLTFFFSRVIVINKFLTLNNVDASSIQSVVPMIACLIFCISMVWPCTICTT